MKIKIYGMGPSRSFRVLWAAEEAEIDYEYIEVNLRSSGENGAQNAAYLANNPQGKVPTLVDDSFVLTESAAIVKYIAAKAPERMLIPECGTQEYARFDEICFFILSELEQPLWTRGKHQFAIPEEYRVPEVIEKTVSWEFNKAQNALLKLMNGRSFAAGNKFSMADILLAHTISWAQSFKFEIADELLKHMLKMKQREAYQQAKMVIEKQWIAPKI